MLAILAGCGSFDLGRPVAPEQKPDPSSWLSSDLNIAYLGHASVLMGFGSTRVLTDPVLYDRIGIRVAGWTLGPKRRIAAALGPDELPKLAAVVVTHAHMDSLDRASLARLASDVPMLVVPARTRDLVDDLGFSRVVELGWGERTEVGDVTVEAIEVAHWGRRWPWDAWRGYNGYVLSHGSTAVLFASDTAYTDRVARAGREHDVEVAILGDGAYDPWVENHATPEQVWRMFKESGALSLLPVHWDTFALGREPIGDAIARLLAAAGPESGAVGIRAFGATWNAPLSPTGGALQRGQGG